MGMSEHRSDREYRKFQNVGDDASVGREDVAVRTDPPKLKVLYDRTSTANRIIRGRARPGTSKMSTGWELKRFDLQGNEVVEEEYAEDPIGTVKSGFVHTWSERLSRFPDVAFFNGKSLFSPGEADQHCLVPHTTDHNFGPEDAFTFILDLKLLVGGSGARTIFEKINGSNNGYECLIQNDGDLEFILRGSGAGDRARFDVNVDLRSGFFKNLIITKDGGGGSFDISNFRCYLDGTLQVLNTLNNTLGASSPTDTNTSSLALASNVSNGSGSRLPGFYDEFAILNASLSQTEVDLIYNGGNGAINLQDSVSEITDNLVSLYRFGDGTFSAAPNIPDEVGGHTMQMQSELNEGNLLPVVRPA